MGGKRATSPPRYCCDTLHRVTHASRFCCAAPVSPVCSMMQMVMDGGPAGRSTSDHLPPTDTVQEALELCSNACSKVRYFFYPKMTHFRSRAVRQQFNFHFFSPG